jgi:hypothetical protein
VAVLLLGGLAAQAAAPPPSNQITVAGHKVILNVSIPEEPIAGQGEQWDKARATRKSWLAETVYFDLNARGEVRVADRKAALKEDEIAEYLKAAKPKVAEAFRKAGKKPLAVLRVRDPDANYHLKEWAAKVNKAGFRFGIDAEWTTQEFARSLKRGPGEARLLVDPSGAIQTLEGKRLASLEAVVKHLEEQAPRLRKEAREAGDKKETLYVTVFGSGGPVYTRLRRLLEGEMADGKRPRPFTHRLGYKGQAFAICHVIVVGEEDEKGKLNVAKQGSGEGKK